VYAVCSRVVICWFLWLPTILVVACGAVLENDMQNPRPEEDPMASHYTTHDHLIREFGELGRVIEEAFAEVDHSRIIGYGVLGSAEDYAHHALRVAERLNSFPRGTRGLEDLRAVVVGSFSAAELFYGVATQAEAGQIATKILEKVDRE
jgi:hypothetical protein